MPLVNLTPNQKAAMLRLERSVEGHERIKTVTANALIRHGLAEYVYPGGNIRLTEFGRRWNDFRSL